MKMIHLHLCLLLGLFPKMARCDSALFEKQTKWLEEKGGYYNKDIVFGSLNDIGPKINGIFAAAPMKKGDYIMIVPAKILITAGPSKNMCDTARNLATEYLLNDASRYEPYVSYVFESFPHQHLPAAWSQRGKDIVAAIVGEHLHPQYFGENTFEEACENKKGDAYINPDTLSAAFRIVTARSWNDVLVPVFDMVNHRNGHYHNIDQKTSAHTGEEIFVVALRDIEKGEQLCISYNECHDVDCEGIAHSYTTPAIFGDYGFVEQYPRRFNINLYTIDGDDDDVSSLVFDLDAKDDVDAPANVTLTWLSDPPDLDDIEFFRDEFYRLKQLKPTIQLDVSGLVDHERGAILDFFQAWIIGLEKAAFWEPLGEGNGSEL